MCPPDQWERLTKGLWTKAMSPFDHKILDIRMAASRSEILQVSIDEGSFSIVASISLFIIYSFLFSNFYCYFLQIVILRYIVNLHLMSFAEFFLYRIFFLVLGILLMSLASWLSKSLVFYYGGAMAAGSILLILMVLFQVSN